MNQPTEQPKDNSRDNRNKCTCKKAEFTRTVTEDYEPMCGRCGKPI